MVPSLPLLSCESSVSVKENPDRKKKKKKMAHIASCFFEFHVYKELQDSGVQKLGKHIDINVNKLISLKNTT